MGPQGEADPTGPQGPAGAAGRTGPAGPQGAAGQQGETGLRASAGAAGADGSPGADAREAEFIVEEGTVAWRFEGEGDDSWRVLASLDATTQRLPQPDDSLMITPSTSGWEVQHIFTVGNKVGDYQPVGILDGAGAFELDVDTVRVLTNHELRPGLGYAYTLDNGTELRGARVSYFDIDKETLAVKSAGLAYDTIITRYGQVLDQATVDLGDSDLGDLRRLCSSAFYAAGEYGLADDIYFTGEETSDGQLYAQDVANNTLYAVPATGRAAYENVTLLDPGDPGKVAIIIGDDRASAPLLLYLGDKTPGGSFMDRNGLASGSLYVWVEDGGQRSSETFYKTGETRSGKFVEINILDESMAGQDGWDALGYASMEVQDEMADAAGAFKFSRPEDVDVNPLDGTQFVLNSTGHRSHPNDLWGTVYVVDVDFSDLSAEVTISYSGDDAGGGQFQMGPDFGLRSPDNLDWANDGYIYQQEDRSYGGFGGVSAQEASIWQMDPYNGSVVRIAQVNRNALLPKGAVDTDPDDLGDWETSGVLDVTTLFGADATTLLINVQAHSLNVDLFGDLVQGGQIVLLRRTEPQNIALSRLGGFSSELGAEIVSYDPGTQRAFVTVGSGVEVLDLSNPAEVVAHSAIEVTGGGSVTSVAVHGGVLAAAVQAEDGAANGMVSFYDTETLLQVGSAEVGVQPDMVTFSPNGQYVLTANEGEPNDDYSMDPAGTVSIIDVSGGVGSSSVTTVGFDPAAFDLAGLMTQGLRVFGPGSSLAEDVEPEYIAVSADSSTAYVTLQENNAIAEVNIAQGTVTAILPLGFKDHSMAGNELDASNRDAGINIRNWDVLGMYQPDAMASYTAADGQMYLVTANEGDARDYAGFSEETRVGDLTLDPRAFPNASTLQQDENLGRLKTTTALGDTDGDGDHDVIYAYGARSFSIWDTSGNLVFDSGSLLAQVLAEEAPVIFNANNFASEFDQRSDDKGSEPEAVTVARLWGRHYAFVALERAGGVFIYDVTYPEQARFVDYFNDVDPYGERFTAGDLGPEGLAVVAAEDSPTGTPLLLVASEWSQTTAVFEISLAGR